MTTTNDITGDRIRSKASNDKFRENFDRIFGKSYKLTYSREIDGQTRFKTVIVNANNLTEVLHKAERTGWAEKGWLFLGVERDD